MKTTLLGVVFIALMACGVSAQQTTFTPNCFGTTDTAAFQSIIDGAVGNPRTIQIPYKSDLTKRCRITTLTVPSHITLDNTNGSGIHVVTSIAVAGPRVNPVGKAMFFGGGTVTLMGRAYDSLADATNPGIAKLSVAPASPTNPIAVGTEDQRIKVFNVKDPQFAGGAKCDGVTDDTVAIRSAKTAAEAVRGELYFPGCLLAGGGSYLVSESLATEIFLITKPIQIRGDGKFNSVILVKSTTGARTDIFRFKPLVPDLDSRGFAFLNLGVNYQSAKNGRHSLLLDATSAFIAQFHVADSFFGVGAGASVCMTNPNNRVDGIFTGTVERNLMLKAPLIDRGGDTLRFVGNSITGPGTNVFEVTIVGGATTFTLDGNNITCGGGVWINSLGTMSAAQTIIVNNIFELYQAGSTGNGGALLRLTGSRVPGSQLYSPIVHNNNFYAGHGSNETNAIAASDTIGLSVKGNSYRVPAGKHFLTLFRTHNTDIPPGSNTNIDGIGGKVSDLGGNTYSFPFETFTATGGIGMFTDFALTTSGTFTLTLPLAASRIGKLPPLTIKNTGAGTITVDGSGAETIDGAPTYSLGANKYVQLFAITGGWLVIGNN